MMCPECKSKQLVKVGKLYRRGGPVQAIQCKECGYKAREEFFLEVIEE